MVRGGIQLWGTVRRYHLNWRLWQPNLTVCPYFRGKIIRATKIEQWEIKPKDLEEFIRAKINK